MFSINEEPLDKEKEEGEWDDLVSTGSRITAIALNYRLRYVMRIITSITPNMIR